MVAVRDAVARLNALPCVAQPVILDVWRRHQADVTDAVPTGPSAAHDTVDIAGVKVRCAC